MDASGTPRPKGLPYWLRYAALALALVGLTGFLVLVVLPERFVLQAGLRESGVSFPARAPGFGPPARSEVVQPPPPSGPPQPPPIGPAQALWTELLPLLEAHRQEEALALMERYLSLRPGDVGVRRERARTLLRAGREEEARDALKALAADPGDVEDRLALARFLRDEGDLDGAIDLYRGLLKEQPGDTPLREELARTLLWAERYGEAESELRAILEEHRGRDDLRLELARALYWSDRLREARAVLAKIAIDSEFRAEAEALDAELADLLTPTETPVEPVDESLLARARRAAAEEDLAGAAELYRSAVAEAPADTALWLEWIDFQQQRLGDLGGARESLIEYGDRFVLTSDLQFRLAELSVWTGHDAEARSTLLALLEAEPDRAEAWSLLGDLERWAGDRPGAAAAYKRAVALDPADSRATAGLEALRARRAELFARREWGGTGPVAEGFGDSDEYRRFDVAAQTTLRFPEQQSTLRAAAGYRWLEGRDLGGKTTDDRGPFAEVEAARWWSEATIRTALRVGVERLDAFGVEPNIGLIVEVPDASGFALRASLDHGPAYSLTATLESALQTVRADRLSVSAFRGLGEAWSIGGALDVSRLDQPGTDNWRWGGWLAVDRSLTSILSFEANTSFVAVFDAAPMASRAIYWDPKAFWATTAWLGLGRRPEHGWGWSLRAGGGAALADERRISSTEWVPQIGATGGVWWSGEHRSLGLEGFYRRSRERGYSAAGVSLQLLLRP